MDEVAYLEVLKAKWPKGVSCPNCGISQNWVVQPGKTLVGGIATLALTCKTCGFMALYNLAALECLSHSPM